MAWWASPDAKLTAAAHAAGAGTGDREGSLTQLSDSRSPDQVEMAYRQLVADGRVGQGGGHVWGDLMREARGAPGAPPVNNTGAAAAAAAASGSQFRSPDASPMRVSPMISPDSTPDRGAALADAAPPLRGGSGSQQQQQAVPLDYFSTSSSQPASVHRSLGGGGGARAGSASASHHSYRGADPTQDVGLLAAAASPSHALEPLQPPAAHNPSSAALRAAEERAERLQRQVDDLHRLLHQRGDVGGGGAAAAAAAAPPPPPSVGSSIYPPGVMPFHASPAAQPPMPYGQQQPQPQQQQQQLPLQDPHTHDTASHGTAPGTLPPSGPRAGAGAGVRPVGPPQPVYRAPQMPGGRGGPAEIPGGYAAEQPPPPPQQYTSAAAAMTLDELKGRAGMRGGGGAGGLGDPPSMFAQPGGDAPHAPAREPTMQQRIARTTSPRPLKANTRSSSYTRLTSAAYGRTSPPPPRRAAAPEHQRSTAALRSSSGAGPRGDGGGGGGAYGLPDDILRSREQRRRDGSRSAPKERNFNYGRHLVKVGNITNHYSSRWADSLRNAPAVPDRPQWHSHLKRDIGWKQINAYDRELTSRVYRRPRQERFEEGRHYVYNDDYAQPMSNDFHPPGYY